MAQDRNSPENPRGRMPAAHSQPERAWQLSDDDVGLAIRSRIATEIRNHPWGSVARDVEQILTYSRPHGVAELFEEVIAQGRAQVVHDERNEVRRRVRAAIDASGLTMEDFAASIGTSRSRLSTHAGGKVMPAGSMLLRIERAGNSADLSHLT